MKTEYANIHHKVDLYEAFFVDNFINTSQLRLIIVNQSQSELDLTLPKLNKSKIGKNNIRVTDRPSNGQQTDRWTDGPSCSQGREKNR